MFRHKDNSRTIFLVKWISLNLQKLRTHDLKAPRRLACPGSTWGRHWHISVSLWPVSKNVTYVPYLYPPPPAARTIMLYHYL